MALSIKDEETDALVRKLAERRKLSMTQAIKLAVSNELKLIERTDKADVDARIKAVREIQRRTRALPELMTAAEVEADMYDEDGLPR
jgi:antitoxin VapB